MKDVSTKCGSSYQSVCTVITKHLQQTLPTSFISKALDVKELDSALMGHLDYYKSSYNFSQKLYVLGLEL